jgi:hypothetical protein
MALCSSLAVRLRCAVAALVLTAAPAARAVEEVYVWRDDGGMLRFTAVASAPRPPAADHDAPTASAPPAGMVVARDPAKAAPPVESPRRVDY